VGLRIVDDGGRDLNGLAEAHVIALEAAANENVHGPITVWHVSAVNFLVEHPVNTFKLMLEVTESRPEGLNLGWHSWNTWINMYKTKSGGRNKNRALPCFNFSWFL
jgi:hypothetical protein